MPQKIASILINNNNVYIPNIGKTENDIYIDVDPVYKSDLLVRNIEKNLETVYQTGNPIIRSYLQNNSNLHNNVILRATSTKSWKELARKGHSYIVSWSEKEIQIEMSKLDKKGRWEFDTQKRKVLPLETSLIEIINIILNDYYARNKFQIINNIRELFK